jgi:hypothetical protein
LSKHSKGWMPSLHMACEKYAITSCIHFSVSYGEAQGKYTIERLISYGSFAP